MGTEKVLAYFGRNRALQKHVRPIVVRNSGQDLESTMEGIQWTKTLHLVLDAIGSLMHRKLMINPKWHSK